MPNSRITTAVKSGYAPVNGLKMYYEIHGEGRPQSAIGTPFGKLLPSLAMTRQVIAVEQQAQGRYRSSALH